MHLIGSITTIQALSLFINNANARSIPCLFTKNVDFLPVKQKGAHHWLTFVFSKKTFPYFYEDIHNQVIKIRNNTSEY